MEFLWLLLVVGAIVAMIILIVRSNGIGERLGRLEASTFMLTSNLQRLEQLYSALLAARHAPGGRAPITPAPAAPPPAPAAVPAAPAPQPAAEQPAPELAPVDEPTPAPEPAVAEPDPAPTAEPAPPEPPPVPQPQPQPRPQPAMPAWAVQPSIAAPAPRGLEWERLIGVNLPVWLGAIALSIGGFFFAAWAIENGLFSPTFRVLGALVLALLLLGAAELVRRRVTRDNGPAIAAALASAAIATLFGTAYIASISYQLIPESAGFAAMALVALAGIAIAMVYGQVVAIVGLLGGYFAPAFFAGAPPSPPLFFGYLTAILVAMFAAIRLRGWWHISLVALAGPAIWMVVWSLSADLAEHQFWIAAFVLAVPVVVSLAALDAWIGDEHAVTFFDPALQFTTARQAVGFSFALAGLGLLLLLRQSFFATAFWQAQMIFAVVTVALAFVRPVSMRFIPFLSLAASVLALMSWGGARSELGAIVTAVLAAAFGFWALDQLRRLKQPATWAAVVAAIAVFFFAVALFKVAGWDNVLANRHLWALAALAMAGVMLALMRLFGPRVENLADRNAVYAAFGAGATAFISLVVVIELDPLLYPVAAALQVLGLAAIHTRAPVRGLRVVAAVLAGIYVLLILGAGTGVGSVAYLPFRFALARSLAEAPLLLLIVPGFCFLAAATLFNRTRNSTDVLANGLDITAIAMLALGIGYQVLPEGFDVPFADMHIAAAKLLAPELLLAVIAVFIGRQLGRWPLYLAGVILTALVAVSMVLALMLPVYWFWPTLNLPGTTLFNVALLSLGLPALMLLGLGWFIRRDADDSIRYTGIATSIAAVFLLFTLMLLEIRHAFHPDLQGPMSEPEYYGYSLGMLAFGIGLLVIGVAIRNLGARMLSLVFVLAATIKVFLFDAAALEGLWRVLSFIGMGLAFLAISWFYARFIFGIGRKPSPGAAVPPAESAVPTPSGP